MHADGQPEVAADDERVAEYDSPQRRIEEGQHGEVQVERVRQSEQDAHGKDRGERASGLYQDLEGVTAEEHFFTDRAEQKEDGHKQKAGPFEMLVRDWLEIGNAHGDG